MDNNQQALTEARIDIGMLKVQVAHLMETVDALQVTNKEQNVKLDQVLLALSAAQGGWKTMMLFGTAATTLGAGAAWLISYLKH